MLLPTRKEKKILRGSTKLLDEDDEVLDSLVLKFRSGALVQRNMNDVPPVHIVTPPLDVPPVPPPIPQTSTSPPNVSCTPLHMNDGTSPPIVSSTPFHVNDVSGVLFSQLKSYFDEKFSDLKSHFDESLSQLKSTLIHEIRSTESRSCEFQDRDRNFTRNETFGDDYHDHEDRGEYYLTPPRVVEEEERNTHDVGGRPFRNKKRSLYMRTPYTRNMKFRRNHGLEFAPLREVSHSKNALFEEFMRKSYSGIPIECGIMSHNKEFFEGIIKDGAWFSSEVCI